MNIRILGSGGCNPIPKPTCQCAICQEARRKGIPYARTGASIYVEPLYAVFDTPEESKEQLNREQISHVDAIFYTHWHPDHTSGMRLVAQLQSHCLAKFIDGYRPPHPVPVYALDGIMDDLCALSNKYGTFLDFYHREGYLVMKRLQPFQSIGWNGCTVTALLVSSFEQSTIYIIEHHDKKVIYAPCNVKPFPYDVPLLHGADLLILGKILPDGKLKDQYEIPAHHELWNDFFSLHEVLDIKQHLLIHQIIGTHIEEDFARSFDDYTQLEKAHQHDIRWAYDGMVIQM